MKYDFLVFLMVAVISLSVALAGCDSGPSPDIKPVSPAMQDDSGSDIPSNAQDAAGTEGSDSGDQEESSAAPASDGSRSLKDIIASKPASFKVTYKMSTTAQGTTTSGEMTMAVNGEDIKIQSVSEVDGQSSESTTYFVKGEVTVCTDQSGCIKMPGADSSGKGVMDKQAEVESNIDSYDIMSTGSRKIAGADAVCFSIKEQNAEYCYSKKEGVPLFVSIDTSDVKSVMEAKSYTTSVPSSEFDVPEAQDISDMLPPGYDLPDMG